MLRADRPCIRCYHLPEEEELHKLGASVIQEMGNVEINVETGKVSDVDWDAKAEGTLHVLSPEIPDIEEKAVNALEEAKQALREEWDKLKKQAGEVKDSFRKLFGKGKGTQQK